VIAPSTIERVRDAAEIVGEVERHVSLRRAGRDFVGLCPFHAEKTPSFHVSPSRQRAHCFGCGWDGDAFAFIMAVEKYTFPGAARSLAGRHGLLLENENPADAERLRQELESEARAAQLLANAEHRLLLELSDELEGLRRLRRAAGASLAAGRKLELSWAALKFVADTLPRMDAAYSIAAFAAPLKRAKFALHPESRPAMIEAVLQRGFVRSAAGYRFGVGLQ